MTMTDGLRSLPMPAPPRDLTEGVLARVAELEQRSAAAGAVDEMRPRPVASAWSSWQALVLSALAAAAVGASIASGNVPLIAPLRTGISETLGSAPAKGQGLALLVTGLSLYAAGLFSSVRPARRTVTPS